MKRNNILVTATSFLMTTILPNAQALGQQISDQQTDLETDEMGEVTVYFGAFLIIVVIAAIVAILTRRVVNAIYTALGLSIIPFLIYFFSNQ